jgi:probable rRNA maturation factor
MPSAYRVSVHVKPAYARFVRTRSLAALARKTLGAEELGGPLALSVVVTDDRAVRALNKRFRRQDRAADVLSFALEPDDGFVAPQGRRSLGEIVISYPTAARQARAARRTTHDELAHLLVHGLLHLLGYDHQRPREAQRMRAREDALLGWSAH